MRNGLIAAIIAVTVALGVGAIVAGYHGTHSEMAGTRTTLMEGRAATDTSPAKPGDYAPPAHPAVPNRDEPGPATIR
jgi:hypothetical protein